MQTDFLVIGSGAAGLSFALKAAEHGTCHRRHQRRIGRVQHQLCAGRYLFGDVCPRHVRKTHPRYAGVRRREMRSGRRGAGGAPCSRADPRPDRMGHALRQDARRAVRAEPRGGPLGAPHPALRGPDGRRDRTCAGGFGAASSQHHPARTALRRRPADAASPGRVRHAPHAGRHLLRRLCARI